MSNKKVIFISPNNCIHTINYDNVEEYCKKICLDSNNIEKFEEFKKNYTYFTPYFDFVMFELEYIFINSLFSGRQGLFHINNALYLYPIKSLNYDECFKNAKELFSYHQPLPTMTTVSDSELGINKSSSTDTGDVIIDPNLYGMMIKTGTISGSHGITANTILNQLLIKSTIICNSYYNFAINGIDFSIDPINYIISHLGFLRATSTDINPMLIGNMIILEKEQKQFIYDCYDNNYKYYDIEDNEAISHIKVYKKIVQPKKS